jgi:asparagine synthase (glutamine-hydrolysing)
MAAQAGIWYYDSRPVPSDALKILSRVNTDIGPHGRALYTADGIAMLSFALHFDQLSLQERQPVRMPNGSALTWDGRLDNRDEFLVRLRAVLTDDHSDARLVALAVQAWQDDALRTAIGDWSLVFWSAPGRVLCLARDYAGNRPLYYCQRQDYFAWSTAIEPLAELCGVESQINDTFIARWLTRHPHDNETIYSELLSVPAGCTLRVRRDRQISCGSFAPFRVHTIRYADARQYEEHYRALFIEAVKARLRARGTVWAELSGGYDSSSVTCIAAGLVDARAVEATRLQPVSTVIPDSPESDESHYIARVEESCHLSSVRVPLRSPFDQPSPASWVQRSSEAPAYRSPYAVASQAGSHVLLSGQFGDDITSGTSAEQALQEYIRSWRFHEFLADSMRLCRANRDRLPSLWMSLAKRFAADARRMHGSRSTSVRNVTDARRSLASDVATACGLRRDFIERALPLSALPDRTLKDIADEPNAILRSLRRYIANGALSGLPENGALRVTHPFSHRPLVNFVLAAPPSILWRPEHPRAFICAALGDVLPDAIIKRRSKGYASPALGRCVMPAVEAALDTLERWELVERGYCDPVAMSAIFGAFLDGSKDSVSVAVRLLTAEYRLRRLRDAHTESRRLSGDAPAAESSAENVPAT